MDDQAHCITHNYHGVVKWFDKVKGYGFVVPDSFDGDILIRSALLEPFGHRTVTEGARISCEAVDSPNGRKAVAITALEAQACSENILHREQKRGILSHVDMSQVPEGFFQAAVKWYNRANGYGFLVHENEDVFIHSETLRAGGIREIQVAEIVFVRIAKTEKGAIAVEIKRP